MREKGRFNDEFDLGPTEKQVRRAEKLLGGFNVPTFVEKRDLTEDYRSGSLLRLDKVVEPVAVMVSLHPVKGKDCHVVLSRDELPEMRAAEVTVKRGGQLVQATGRLEPGHSGRRESDVQDGKTLMVSFFYPVASDARSAFHIE